MIIDCILSRYEKSRENGSYFPERFRDSVENYINIFPNAVEIVYAMDKGSEQEVKASLITYLIDNKNNPRIMDYVLSVDWLKDIPKEEPSVVDLDAPPANEQEYEEQIEHYKQIVNELTGKNTYDINNNELQNIEIDAIYDFLNACKIYDITVAFDNNIIIAKDDDGNRWEGAELYRFLLNEVIILGADNKPVDGFCIDEKIVSSVLEFAKKYGYETPEYNIDKSEVEPDICE